MITTEEAIKKLAGGAANPKCNKCYGRGTRGRIIRKVGSTVLICQCATKGFRNLNSGHIPIKAKARNAKQ